jgi:hypothetical protein
MLNQDVLELFKDAWSQFDPDATGYINIQYFADMMFELQDPLGWDESYIDDPEKQERFFLMAAGG